jgi:hypothetical protein
MDLASATLAALEWLLVIQIPPKSAASFKVQIAADAEDPEGKVGCEALIDLHREALRRSAPARDALREQVQPAWVAGLRAAGAQFAPGWKAVFDLYDAANAPIAAGEPPLTQESAQCYFNLLAFHQALVSDEEWRPLPEMARSDYTRKLVEVYPGMPASVKQWVGRLPALWTGLYAEWTELTPDQRAARRDGLIAQLSVLKTLPMADLPMHAGRFEPTRVLEQRGRQDAIDSLMGALRFQGAVLSSLAR